MRFKQITFKKKLITIVSIVGLLLLILIVNNSIKKMRFHKFINDYDNNMAQLMVSIDINNMENTLLTKQNIKFMQNIKLILENYIPPETGRESYFYLSSKKEYLVMEKVFKKASDWDNVSQFDKNQIVTFILSQKVMYEQYLNESK